jgi:hypothetical protein
MSKPRGYFEKVLAIDVETSGMAFNEDDPSINTATGETYQIVSIGLVVASALTFKPVEELYLEIKWDGVSKWEAKAESVHGLSKSYLAEAGVTPEDAVVAIANLIADYWGNDVPVCLLGHNVSTFDIWFLKRLLRSFDIHVRFGSRTVDTNAIGLATFGTFNSDDLFELVGMGVRDPAKHNALDDAKMALAVCRFTKQLWTEVVLPELV